MLYVDYSRVIGLVQVIYKYKNNNNDNVDDDGIDVYDDDNNVFLMLI